MTKKRYPTVTSRRSNHLVNVREAPFALRVVERSGGLAAIVYRRRADPEGRDRLQRVGALGSLAYQAGLPLLRSAVVKSQDPRAKVNGLRLDPGGFIALDQEWGARVACFALVSSGLRDGERLSSAARHLAAADAAEAAWWLGLMTQTYSGTRALRALRILVEAVE
jgi:hypothetical protein